MKRQLGGRRATARLHWPRGVLTPDSARQWRPEQPRGMCPASCRGYGGRTSHLQSAGHVGRRSRARSARRACVGLGTSRSRPPGRCAFARAAPECGDHRGGLCAAPAPGPAVTPPGRRQRDGSSRLRPRGGATRPPSGSAGGDADRPRPEVQGWSGADPGLQLRDPARARPAPQPRQLRAADARPAPHAPATCPWGEVTAPRAAPCRRRSPSPGTGAQRPSVPSPASAPARLGRGRAHPAAAPGRRRRPGRGLLGPSPAGGRGAPVTAPRGSVLLGRGAATCPVTVRGLSPPGLAGGQRGRRGWDSGAASARARR